MADIKKELNQIKTAIYGKDVRGSIHDGIDKINKESEDSKQKANEAHDVMESIINDGFDNAALEANFEQKLDDEIGRLQPEWTQFKNDTEQNFNSVTSQLNDNAISPDIFDGTDREKVQQAFTKSVEDGVAIRLSRLYDLTGEEPIDLNKIGDTGRSVIYFIGVGGGFKKTDSGAMFSSSKNNSGDYSFSGVKFMSIKGAGTIVFDGNALIRVTAHNCTFRYVDYFAKTNRFLQSYFINGGSMVGGDGYAIETPSVFDFQVGGGFFAEQRESFFKQTNDATTSFDRLYGARFRDCMIEGLTGEAFRFRNVESLIIDGVYFEANKGGHIIFGSDSRIDGTEISNNRVSEVDGSGIPAFIQWGGRIINAKTSNNNVRRIPVHSTTRVTSGRILNDNNRGFNPLSSGDVELSNIDPSGRLYKDINQRFADVATSIGVVEGKINKNTVALNDKIGTWQFNQALENLGDMTPKRAFSTLGALQNAYPNGAQGVFLVQSSGHWYWWNGQWIDGGAYQATPFAEFMTEENEIWE